MILSSSSSQFKALICYSIGNDHSSLFFRERTSDGATKTSNTPHQPTNSGPIAPNLLNMTVDNNTSFGGKGRVEVPVAG